jgi:hypothetical protein
MKASTGRQRSKSTFTSEKPIGDDPQLFVAIDRHVGGHLGLAGQLDRREVPGQALSSGLARHPCDLYRAALSL